MKKELTLSEQRMYAINEQLKKLKQEDEQKVVSTLIDELKKQFDLENNYIQQHRKGLSGYMLDLGELSIPYKYNRLMAKTFHDNGYKSVFYWEQENLNDKDKQVLEEYKEMSVCPTPPYNLIFVYNLE